MRSEGGNKHRARFNLTLYSRCSIIINAEKFIFRQNAACLSWMKRLAQQQLMESRLRPCAIRRFVRSVSGLRCFEEFGDVMTVACETRCLRRLRRFLPWMLSMSQTDRSAFFKNKPYSVIIPPLQLLYANSVLVHGRRPVSQKLGSKRRLRLLQYVSC